MLITLLTDFGTSDTYVGQMKGVLAAMVENVPVVDLTHRVGPQDVLAAAVHLDAAVDAFAEDTIHLAVVDPGVGTQRRGIAARFERGTLVGPDNGLFTAVFERYPPTKIISLDDPAFMRKSISDTFHGRDVFAPIASHLARGVHITELGEEVTAPVRLDLPRPRRESQTLMGRVLLADHFGNLITNLRREEIEHWLSEQQNETSRAGAGPSPITVEIADQTIPAISRTFAETAMGQLVAYFGSSGRLEIAIRNANAAQHLGYSSRTAMSVCLIPPNAQMQKSDPSAIGSDL